MLVKDFKENEGYRFSEMFLESLPDYCLDPRCSSPTEMTETLTNLRCSNPRCPSKLAQRVVSMLKDIGVKDMGDARANSFISKLVNTWGSTNIMLLFAYEPEDGQLGDDISLEVSKKIFEQISKNKTFTLGEYVRVANLPFIQTSALTIFDEYDDINKAYEDIEYGGVEFIADKLGIKKGNVLDTGSSDEVVSIRALKIFESLMTFKSDLIEGVDYVNIVKKNSSDMKTFRVKCSEEVGGIFARKADFYSTVNNLYPDIHVEFVGSVTKKIDYLVWAGADGMHEARVSNSVKKARKYNDDYFKHKEAGILKEGEHEIKIVTAEQFLGILQGIEEGKNN